MIDGVRVRYADSGGAHSRTVLLTSPWPESIYAFHSLWGELTAHARVFAVDLPGFGRSESSATLMSPRAMGGFLTRFIGEARLDRPLIVAPDVGTPAALFAAAYNPGLLSGLVVGAGGTAVPIQLGEPLSSWVLAPDVEKYRSIDPHAIVDAAITNNGIEVPDDVRADYHASYEGDRFFESMRYARRYPVELPILARLLPGIATPVTIIGALHDHVVPPANAEFLAARLPNGRLVFLDSGHFAWEQKPAAYARIVLDTLDGTGAEQ